MNCLDKYAWDSFDCFQRSKSWEVTISHGWTNEADRQVLIELTEQPQALSEQETEATHQLDIPLEVPKSS